MGHELANLAVSLACDIALGMVFFEYKTLNMRVSGERERQLTKFE